MNYVAYYGDSWRRMYLERHLQEYLEQLKVEDYKLNTLTSLLTLCAPYVRKLEIRQLQIAKPLPQSECQGDECSVEPIPSDHINLEPVIKFLDNLEELSITFGLRDCALFFSWSLFKFSPGDCVNIGFGLDSAQHLTVLRIHRSHLDDVRACIILKHLVKNKTLLELDFSHCHLTDGGALAVGQLITVHPKLTNINLCNNKIGAEGAKGLGYALQKPDGCPLESLNLRLNYIGDEGAEHLCAGIVHSTKPKDLNLAANGIKEKGAFKIGQLLERCSVLHYLDLSNNSLGELGGKALERGLAENTSLRILDLRMTDIPSEIEYIINNIVKKNFDNLEGVLANPITSAAFEPEIKEGDSPADEEETSP